MLKAYCTKCNSSFFTENKQRVTKQLCISCDDDIEKPRIIKEYYS